MFVLKLADSEDFTNGICLDLDLPKDFVRVINDYEKKFNESLESCFKSDLMNMYFIMNSFLDKFPNGLSEKDVKKLIKSSKKLNKSNNKIYK